MNEREMLGRVLTLAEEAYILPSSEVAYSPAAAEACRQNYCGRYGKSWSCPPAGGGEGMLEAVKARFAHALLFSTVHSLEDSYDIEGMDRAREAHTRVQDEVISACGLDDCAAFGAGSCTVCRSCTYPTAPCRFPERMRRAVESLGVEVTALCAKTGLLYHHGENTVTYFSLIFF